MIIYFKCVPPFLTHATHSYHNLALFSLFWFLFSAKYIFFHHVIEIGLQFPPLRAALPFILSQQNCLRCHFLRQKIIFFFPTVKLRLQQIAILLPTAAHINLKKQKCMQTVIFYRHLGENYHCILLHLFQRQ